MNRRGAVRDIAASEHVGRGGLVGFAIHLDEPALRLHAIGRIEERQVGSLADGENNAVGGNVLHVGFVERRIEFPASVEDRRAAHRAQRRNFPRFENHFPRAALIVQANAFVGAFDHFDLVGRHLGAALQANHVDFFVAAQAQCRTGHVVHLMAVSGRTADRATSYATLPPPITTPVCPAAAACRR
jgi:hypothetical protein